MQINSQDSAHRMILITELPMPKNLAKKALSSPNVLATSTHRQMNDEQLAAVGIPAGLIHISCGLEDKNDLIADIAQALDAI